MADDTNSAIDGHTSKIEAQKNGKFQAYVDEEKVGHEVHTEQEAKLMIERHLRGEMDKQKAEPTVRSRRLERKDG
jgi:hypothetical protein